jgi:hypothetical protein
MPVQGDCAAPEEHEREGGNPRGSQSFKRNAFSPPRFSLRRVGGFHAGTYHLIHDAIRRKRHRSRT